MAEEENGMPTYIGLLKWTEQGARNAKDALTRVPGRANVYTGGRMNVVGGGQKWQSPVAS